MQCRPMSRPSHPRPLSPRGLRAAKVSSGTDLAMQTRGREKRGRRGLALQMASRQLGLGHCRTQGPGSGLQTERRVLGKVAPRRCCESETAMKFGLGLGLELGCEESVRGFDSRSHHRNRRCRYIGNLGFGCSAEPDSDFGRCSGFRLGV